MRKLIAFMALLALAAPAVAQVHVKGYFKKDGTYVAPHVRSSPNSTTLDNYSTRGNVNPYNGRVGTRDPQPDYGTPRTRTFGSGSSGSDFGTTRTPCYYNCD